MKSAFLIRRKAALLLLLVAWVLMPSGCIEDCGGDTLSPNNTPGNGGANDPGGPTTGATLAIHPCGWVDPTKAPIMDVPNVIGVDGAFPKDSSEYYVIRDAKGNAVAA